MRLFVIRASALKLSFVLSLLLLTSCAVSMQEQVSNRLDTGYPGNKSGNNSVNFSIENKCQPEKSLNVLNKEDKNIRYKADIYYLDSREFADSIVNYIKTELKTSNVKINDVDGKEVHVFIEDFVISWAFNWGVRLKLRITIPDINYHRVYEGYDRSGSIYNAVAHAVHLATMEFLQDPVVQSYLTCNKITDGAL